MTLDLFLPPPPPLLPLFVTEHSITFPLVLGATWSPAAISESCTITARTGHAFRESAGIYNPSPAIYIEQSYFKS